MGNKTSRIFCIKISDLVLAWIVLMLLVVASSTDLPTSLDIVADMGILEVVPGAVLLSLLLAGVGLPEMAHSLASR